MDFRSRQRIRDFPQRDPEQSPLHKVLATHLETFLSRNELDPSHAGLPAFVHRELREAVTCGIFANGFARVHCPTCSRDHFVAFSCKGRGFCPSCGGRRMAESAAHLTDHVIPDVPVRQWVVTFPWRIRFLLARDRALLCATRRSILRLLLAATRKRAGFRARHSAHGGAVCHVQRFGSALNLNLHLHALLLDGAYTATPSGLPTFHPAPPPTDDEVADLLRLIRDCVARILMRAGIDDPHASGESFTQLDFINAASIQGRTALGVEHESKLKRLGIPTTSARDAPTRRAPLCSALEGFSLHAAVSVPYRRRDRLERLCRYITRPALASTRLTLDRRGNVLLKLKRPFRDGTSHFSFTPLAFLERLAALVPPPRAHLLTYHGVLAPASTLCSRAVPTPPPRPLRSKGLSESSCDPRNSWAELMKRVFALCWGVHLSGRRAKRT